MNPNRTIVAFALGILLWALADAAFHAGARSCTPAPAGSTDSPRITRV